MGSSDWRVHLVPKQGQRFQRVYGQGARHGMSAELQLNHLGCLLFVFCSMFEINSTFRKEIHFRGFPDILTLKSDVGFVFGGVGEGLVTLMSFPDFAKKSLEDLPHAYYMCPGSNGHLQGIYSFFRASPLGCFGASCFSGLLLVEAWMCCVAPSVLPRCRAIWVLHANLLQASTFHWTSTGNSWYLGLKEN